jgi:hypothetical protein
MNILKSTIISVLIGLIMGCIFTYLSIKHPNQYWYQSESTPFKIYFEKYP